jgi:hypothetical protein
MADLKKKKMLAYVLTIATLANLWASIALDMPNSFVKGVTTMATVILIGATIERWARFNRAYIEYKIDERMNNKK